MKKLSTLKHKIIFYVMSVAVLLAVLITLNMSIGSIVSTNTVLLENMQNEDCFSEYQFQPPSAYGADL